MLSRRLPLILDAPVAGRMVKAHPTLAPFAVLRRDIFGNENNLSGPADEFVLDGAGLRRDQCEDRGAIGRGDSYPTDTGWELGIKGKMEAKLIQVKA